MCWNTQPKQPSAHGAHTTVKEARYADWNVAEKGWFPNTLAKSHLQMCLAALADCVDTSETYIKKNIPAPPILSKHIQTIISFTKHCEWCQRLGDVSFQLVRLPRCVVTSKAMVSKTPSQQATNSKYTTLALPRGNRNLQSMSGSTHANGLTIRTLTKAAVRPQPKITDSNPLLRISSSLKLRKSIRRANMPNLFVLRVLQKQLQKSQPIHMMTSQSDKEM